MCHFIQFSLNVNLYSLGHELNAQLKNNKAENRKNSFFNVLF